MLRADDILKKGDNLFMFQPISGYGASKVLRDHTHRMDAKREYKHYAVKGPVVVTVFRGTQFVVQSNVANPEDLPQWKRLPESVRLFYDASTIPRVNFVEKPMLFVD